MVILVGIFMFVCGFLTCGLFVRLGLELLCRKDELIIATRIENTDDYECSFTGDILKLNE